ncbi:hypothetical protein PROFUN_06489 [Planoprotostelium fungivorum]|uniref:Transmembrane protein n=1 Tax=Planoprotostelium fungivorum TaxID=1890364 RepID=A0A2P6NNY0_9EUKA|nr:hypothetical protein PROFUN_06489 [Planoprotostelium fungivorum]
MGKSKSKNNSKIEEQPLLSDDYDTRSTGFSASNSSWAPFGGRLSYLGRHPCAFVTIIIAFIIVCILPFALIGLGWWAWYEQNYVWCVYFLWTAGTLVAIRLGLYGWQFHREAATIFGKILYIIFPFITYLLSALLGIASHVWAGYQRLQWKEQGAAAVHFIFAFFCIIIYPCIWCTMRKFYKMKNGNNRKSKQGYAFGL